MTLLAPDFDDPNHEWWPRPSDGKLVPLILQGAEDPRFLPPTSRWTRLGKPVSQVTPLVRMCNWIGSTLFIPGSREFRSDFRSIFVAVIKFIVSWPFLCLLVCWSENCGLISRMTKQHNLHLLPSNSDTRQEIEVTHQTGACPEQATTNEPSRQHQDNVGPGQGRSSSRPVPTYSGLRDDIALLRPRYLCVLKSSPDLEGTYDYETVNVKDYLKRNGDGVDLEFVFISYTRMQFRVSTDDEISKYDYPEPKDKIREANRQVARRDRDTLIRIGIDAAKYAKRKAFWLDFECVRDNGVAQSSSSSEDVYRICDIVRAAHSMIIAIGPAVDDKVKAVMNDQKLEDLQYNPAMVTYWLQQWGSRLWTLPELLLCPGEHRIRLYVIGNPSEPREIAKRNFAAEGAWDDASEVQQLVDHFEGSAILAPSSLIEAALTCFSRRQTDQFSRGDIAYATMGLFPSSQRPRVDQSDTGFQAFGKLALENGSAAFLHQLLCLSTPQGSPWYMMKDRWSVRLRDISPVGKLRGVLAPETVILEGVFGTTIHWDNIDAEPYFGKGMGTLDKFILHEPYVATAILLYCFITFLVLESKTAIIYPALIGLFALLLPLGIINSRRRLQQPIVPRLIGIEGAVDVGTIERYLWGFNHGNLEEDTTQIYNDSPSNDPQTLNPPTAPHVFTFTLVDTHTMRVTQLKCNIPPVAMFVCGEDNDAYRATLCSYDWSTQTYHRQFVLRSNRWKLKNLRLFERVDMSLAPHAKTQASAGNYPQGPLGSPVSVVSPLSKDGNCVPLGERPSRWRRELLFAAMCLFGLDFYYPDNYLGPNGDLYYNFAFIAAQALAFTVLSRTSLHQIFPYVAFVKVCLAVPGSRHGMTQHLWILCGILDGWKVAMLLSLLPEWYLPHELPVRFLLCLTVTPKLEMLFGFFGASYMWCFRPAASLVQSCLQWTLLFKVPSGLIGRPREVSWLEAHERVILNHNAGIRKFLNDTGGHLWRCQKSAFHYLRTFSFVFVQSLLNSLIPMPPEMLNWDSYRTFFIDALVAIMIGLAIFHRPSSTYTIMCFSSMVSGYAFLLNEFSTFGHISFIALHVLTRLRGIVVPLLLSIAVSGSTFWIQAASFISISYVGTSMGNMILTSTTEQAMYLWDFTVKVYFPLVLTQTIIWLLFWKHNWLHDETMVLHAQSTARDVESQVLPEDGPLPT